jgi:hypothetical protein
MEKEQGEECSALEIEAKAALHPFLSLACVA